MRLDRARRHYQLRLVRTRETEWHDDLNRLWLIYGIPKNGECVIGDLSDHVQ